MDSSMLLWGAPPPAAAAKTTENENDKAVPENEKEEKNEDAETFKELGVVDWLVKTASDLSIIKPTEVQARGIPVILNGKDVCATACTGSGKTAAYALPIIQNLAKDPYGVYACCITPTREITMQVSDQFRIFGSRFSVHVVTLIGGVENQPQQRELEKRPPIVVATPGRLRDTLQVHNTLLFFRKMRYLVLDEADRLLDESFEDTMDDILDLFKKIKYQLLLFSATLSATALATSGALKRLKWDAKPFSVIDTGETEEGIYTSADNLTESYLFMPQQVKLCYLSHVMEGCKQIPWKSAMIFAASCRECEVVRLTLQELGLPVVSINSLLEQKTRMENLSLFKVGRAKILVATDVASRGLDIPKVDLVVNYDLPKLSKTYVHRAGRTARAGRSGTALTLVTPQDIKNLHKIERHIDKKLSEVKVNDAACTNLLDVVIAARTRAKLSINQRFGDRLREAEDNKVKRNMKREIQQEIQDHWDVTQHKKARREATQETQPVEPAKKKLVKKTVKKKKKIVS